MVEMATLQPGGMPVMTMTMMIYLYLITFAT